VQEHRVDLSAELFVGLDHRRLHSGGDLGGQAVIWAIKGQTEIPPGK
jgi:hypothetical protein